MLRVRVELEPHGNADAARAVAEVEIVNVTFGRLRMTADYAWRIREARSGLTAMGWIVDWWNDATSVHLLAAVLDEWRSGRPLPIDNHGNPAVPQGQDAPEEFWRRHDENRED